MLITLFCCGLFLIASPVCVAESLNDQMEAAVDLPSDMPESEYRALQDRKQQLDQERELLDGEIKLFNIDCGSVPGSDEQKIRVCRARQLMIQARIDNYRSSLASFKMAIRAAQLKTPHLDSSVVDLRDKKSDVVDLARVKNNPALGLQWKQAAPQQAASQGGIPLPAGTPVPPPATPAQAAAPQKATVTPPPSSGELAVRSMVLKELLKNPLADAGIAARDTAGENELTKMIVEDEDVQTAFNTIVKEKIYRELLIENKEKNTERAIDAAIADLKQAEPESAGVPNEILRMRVMDDPAVKAAIDEALIDKGSFSEINADRQREFWDAVKRAREK